MYLTETSKKVNEIIFFNLKTSKRIILINSPFLFFTIMDF